MADEVLKCKHCGVRRLVDLRVYGTNGVDLVDAGQEDAVVLCIKCNRVYRIVTAGDSAQLELVMSTTADMVTMRTL